MNQTNICVGEEETLGFFVFTDYFYDQTRVYKLAFNIILFWEFICVCACMFFFFVIFVGLCTEVENKEQNGSYWLFNHNKVFPNDVKVLSEHFNFFIYSKNGTFLNFPLFCHLFLTQKDILLELLPKQTNSI